MQALLLSSGQPSVSTPPSPSLVSHWSAGLLLLWSFAVEYRGAWSVPPKPSPLGYAAEPDVGDWRAAVRNPVGGFVSSPQVMPLHCIALSATLRSQSMCASCTCRPLSLPRSRSRDLPIDTGRGIKPPPQVSRGLAPRAVENASPYMQRVSTAAAASTASFVSPSAYHRHPSSRAHSSHRQKRHSPFQAAPDGRRPHQPQVCSHCFLRRMCAIVPSRHVPCSPGALERRRVRYVHHHAQLRLTGAVVRNA
jgi:hypothetical protein